MEKSNYSFIYRVCNIRFIKNSLVVVATLLLMCQTSKADKISETWQNVNIHGYMYLLDYYNNSENYGTGFYNADGSKDYDKSATRVRLNVDINSGEYNGWTGTIRIRAQDQKAVSQQSADNSFDLWMRYYYVTKDFGKGPSGKIAALHGLVAKGGKQYISSPFEDDLGTGLRVDYNIGKLLIRGAYYGNTGYGSDSQNENGKTNPSLDLTYVALGYGDITGYRNDKIPFLINFWGMFGTNADKTNDLYSCDLTAIGATCGTLDPSTDNAGGVPGDQNPILTMANIGFNTKHFGFKGQYAYVNYGGHVDSDYGSSVTYGQRGAIEVSAYITDTQAVDVGWAITGKSGKVAYDGTDAGIVDAENALLGENYVAYSTESNANYVWIRYRGQFFDKKLTIQLSYQYLVSKYDPEEMTGNAVYTGSSTRFVSNNFELIGFASYMINKHVGLSEIVSYAGFDVADNYQNLINNDSSLSAASKKQFIKNDRKADNGIVYSEFQATYYF